MSYIQKPDYSDARYSGLSNQERNRQYQRDLMLYEQQEQQRKQNELQQKQNELQQKQINMQQQLAKEQNELLRQQNEIAQQTQEYKAEYKKTADLAKSLTEQLLQLKQDKDKVEKNLNLYKLADMLNLKRNVLEQFLVSYFSGDYGMPKNIKEAGLKYLELSDEWYKLYTNNIPQQKLNELENNNTLITLESNLNYYKKNLWNKIFNKQKIIQMEINFNKKQEEHNKLREQYSKELEEQDKKIKDIEEEENKYLKIVREWSDKTISKRKADFNKFRRTHYNEIIEYYLKNLLQDYQPIDNIEEYGEISDYSKYINNVLKESK